MSLSPSEQEIVDHYEIIFGLEQDAKLSKQLIAGGVPLTAFGVEVAHVAAQEWYEEAAPPFGPELTIVAGMAFAAVGIVGVGAGVAGYITSKFRHHSHIKNV